MPYASQNCWGASVCTVTRALDKNAMRWWCVSFKSSFWTSSCRLAGKRRYDRKQSGYGGQTKPVFHKKAKTTKKIVLRLQCQICKAVHMHPLKVRLLATERLAFHAGHMHKEWSYWDGQWLKWNLCCIIVCSYLFLSLWICLILPKVSFSRQAHRNASERYLLICSICTDSLLITYSLLSVQRCKHFEIGGDKKGKNQMY